MFNFVNCLIEKVKVGEIDSKDVLLSVVMLDCTNDSAYSLYDWLKPCHDDKEGMLNGLESFKKSNYIFSGRRIAEFEKVSFDRFKEDLIESSLGNADWVIESMYNEIIKLPERATKGSAGYDFVTPVDICLKPGETIKFPTGIRCRMHPDWVLKVYPRSGYGFKYRAQLDNTVGIIDSDYYYSENEGHIFVKITNDSKSCKELKVPAGSAICQGIFVEYGITVNDNAEGIRNGGFGSTSK